MADVHTPAIRSYNMSKIRSKDTKPELIVRRYLHANGFRYKLHVRELPGNPDIVLPKYRTIVYIQGCFWHGHQGCKYFVTPKTRTDWWLYKINTNIKNDIDSQKKLIEKGWKVIVVWECELLKPLLTKTLEEVKLKIVLD